MNLDSLKNWYLTHRTVQSVELQKVQPKIMSGLDPI